MISTITVTKKFSLGSKERLKSRKSIEQLFTNGKKIVIAPYRTLYLMNTSQGKPILRFGAGVSARNFKKAVDRNRIKRLIREAYRLQKNELQEQLIAKNSSLDIFIIYTAKELPVYQDVYMKVGLVLEKLNRLLEQ